MSAQAVTAYERDTVSGGGCIRILAAMLPATMSPSPVQRARTTSIAQKYGPIRSVLALSADGFSSVIISGPAQSRAAISPNSQFRARLPVRRKSPNGSKANTRYSQPNPFPASFSKIQSCGTNRPSSSVGCQRSYWPRVSTWKNLLQCGDSPS